MVVYNGPVERPPVPLRDSTMGWFWSVVACGLIHHVPLGGLPHEFLEGRLGMLGHPPAERPALGNREMRLPTAEEVRERKTIASPIRWHRSDDGANRRHP